MMKNAPAPAPGRVKAARMIAVGADLLQWAILPAFIPGAVSPVNDALDVAVAGALTWLIGWHWSFLPSFAAELVPGFNLVPTWTAAVLFATRGQGTVRPPSRDAGAIDAEVISSEPAPGAPAGTPPPGRP